jgi:hypothetical protein
MEFVDNGDLEHLIKEHKLKSMFIPEEKVWIIFS